MKNKYRIRKRSYLLLEIMLSIALLSLCLIPLIHPHFGILKAEYRYVKVLQMNRIAQNSLCSLKQMLAEGRLPWHQLDNARPITGELEPTRIRCGNQIQMVTPRYLLKKISYANKPKLHKNALLVEVTISFDDQVEFVHNIFLERHEKTSFHTT